MRHLLAEIAIPARFLKRRRVLNDNPPAAANPLRPEEIWDAVQLQEYALKEFIGPKCLVYGGLHFDDLDVGWS
jgi:hypothetical protein